MRDEDGIRGRRQRAGATHESTATRLGSTAQRQRQRITDTSMSVLRGGYTDRQVGISSLATSDTLSDRTSWLYDRAGPSIVLSESVNSLLLEHEQLKVSEKLLPCSSVLVAGT